LNTAVIVLANFPSAATLNQILAILGFVCNGIADIYLFELLGCTFVDVSLSFQMLSLFMLACELVISGIVSRYGWISAAVLNGFCCVVSLISFTHYLSTIEAEPEELAPYEDASTAAIDKSAKAPIMNYLYVFCNSGEQLYLAWTASASVLLAAENVPDTQIVFILVTVGFLGEIVGLVAFAGLSKQYPRFASLSFLCIALGVLGAAIPVGCHSLLGFTAGSFFIFVSSSSMGGLLMECAVFGLSPAEAKTMSGLTMASSALGATAVILVSLSVDARAALVLVLAWQGAILATLIVIGLFFDGRDGVYVDNARPILLAS
jgi:hypothetical protein